MLNSRMWSHASKTIASSGLKGTGFGVEEIIKRASFSGDFVIVTGMVDDHNLDPKSERKIKDAEANKSKNRKPVKLTVAETAKNARAAAKIKAGIVVPDPVR